MNEMTYPPGKVARWLLGVDPRTTDKDVHPEVLTLKRKIQKSCAATLDMFLRGCPKKKAQVILQGALPKDVFRTINVEWTETQQPRYRIRESVLKDWYKRNFWGYDVPSSAEEAGITYV